jgi:hypothetical protein
VRDWLNGSTANDYNHWTEIQVWGRATVAYVGNYFEWHTNAASGAGNPKTMVRYYYAGAQRVAVRHSNGGPTGRLASGPKVPFPSGG